MVSGPRKVLLTRPPRFGKTMFCQMLGTYVDKATTDEVFRQCFAGTAIDKLATEGDQDVQFSLNRLRRKCAWLSLVSGDGWREMVMVWAHDTNLLLLCPHR